MAKFNYSEICRNLLKGLPQKNREIIQRRFGLGENSKETLEAIGKDYGITRERVRQIEQDGISRLSEKISSSEQKGIEKLFSYFQSQIESDGNLRKEKSLLKVLGEDRYQNEVFFLLNLGSRFKRHKEDQQFCSFWFVDRLDLGLVRRFIEALVKKFKILNSSLLPEQLVDSLQKEIFPKLGFSLTPSAIFSFIEVSKIVSQGPNGDYGLSHWPQISPKGIKDEAYLILRREKKPLHFTKVADRLERPVLIQSIHNELIKDSRFVLVGRGIYALQEWGYRPGTAKEVIGGVLKEAGHPLKKEEIIKKVLEQRLIKKNTVLLNLNDKKYFIYNSENKYQVRKI